MAIKFPSEAWIEEMSRKLNASESYYQSAKDWEGDFTFVVESDDVYDTTTYLYLGLHHGKSPDASEIQDLEEKNTEYTIRAPYSIWRKVIEGKIDPIQGLMTKRLKLQGNMMMVMRYPKAAKEIMACAKQIPTEFAE